MISLILAALVSTAAADNETPAVAPPAPAAERKICKVEKSSASRLGAKRVCRTEAEWKAYQDSVTRDLDKRERQ